MFRTRSARNLRLRWKRCSALLPKLTLVPRWKRLPRINDAYAQGGCAAMCAYAGDYSFHVDTR